MNTEALSVWNSLKFVVWERVNPLPHNAAFLYTEDIHV